MSRLRTERRSHLVRAGVYLALGVLLVSSLVFATPASVVFGSGSESDFTYTAVEVTAESGALAFDGEPPDDGLRGVDCLSDYSRLCGLEVRQLDGDVTVEKVNPVERRAAPYVAFFDQYYRRVHERNGSTITYGLQPVSAGTVLDDIARPVAETNRPSSIRRLVSEGTAAVPHRLRDPTQAVRSGESYYVFNYQRGETPRDQHGTGVAALGRIAMLLVGLWSLRRGWVQYDRWRASRRDA
ncbi:hypothetical protein [Halarchaeum rubridurum]|uniref:hypothetical protein n=1 Tax=Halarchaeum rubridurum TaxID=489911 RepID=UPI001AE13519|nr:hypothetical protein [Halarchaeum rubridurum]